MKIFKDNAFPPFLEQSSDLGGDMFAQHKMDAGDDQNASRKPNERGIPIFFRTFYCLKRFSFSNSNPLTKTAGFSFPFEQAQDVSLADGSLYVSDNAAAGTFSRLNEFDTDLCHITGVTGTSQHSVDLGKLNWLILNTDIAMARKQEKIISTQSTLKCTYPVTR